MNYKYLIDRLRATGLQSAAEAADVIESLTAQLASGPVAWTYEIPDANIRHVFKLKQVNLAEGWIERPLYHIPIPTEE